MRPLDGEGPKPKPITDVPSRTNPFIPNLYFRGLGKMGQNDQSQRANDSRTPPVPKGGYGGRGNFNYGKPEDRGTEGTRDVNRGSSGLKKGIPFPERKRRWNDFRTEDQKSAIERRLRTTRNT
jgi:hypothetical protein